MTEPHTLGANMVRHPNETDLRLSFNWYGAFVFSLLLDRTNSWTNNRVPVIWNAMTLVLIKKIFISLDSVVIRTTLRWYQFSIWSGRYLWLIYRYYCINWSWSVLDQAAEGGSSLTPAMPAHLSTPFITGRGIGIETCRAGGASSWWPLDWFGYLHELCVDI